MMMTMAKMIVLENAVGIVFAAAERMMQLIPERLVDEGVVVVDAREGAVSRDARRSNILIAG